MSRQLHMTLLVGFFSLMAVAAQAAPPTVATEEEKRAAQKMFEAGDGLYESGRFEDAVAAFKNSHDLVASPNSRLMLARSRREAGHLGEACEEFRGTIRDAEASGGRYPEALQAAQSELKALENLQAAIELSPQLREQLVELRVNGRPVTSPTGRVPVMAGNIALEYRLKDGSTHTTTISLTQGQSHLVEVEQPATKPRTLDRPAAPSTTANPSPATTPNHTLRTAAWISAGVGVVGLSAFGVFGYLDRKTYNSLQSDCQNRQCPADSLSKIDDGRRYQLLANVGLGVAIVGTAAAVTLFVISPRSKTEGPQLALRSNGTGLLVDGQF